MLFAAPPTHALLSRALQLSFQHGHHRLRGIDVRPEVHAAIGRKSRERVAAVPKARGGVKVSLRLELLERVPVPPIGDHVGSVGHQHFEAVKLRAVEGVRVMQPHPQQIEERVEARDVNIHLAT